MLAPKVSDSSAFWRSSICTVQRLCVSAGCSHQLENQGWLHQRSLHAQPPEPSFGSLPLGTAQCTDLLPETQPCCWRPCGHWATEGHQGSWWLIFPFGKDELGSLGTWCPNRNSVWEYILSSFSLLSVLLPSLPTMAMSKLVILEAAALFNDLYRNQNFFMIVNTCLRFQWLV